MNEINIVTAQNVTLRIELASIGDRFIASFLDLLVKMGVLIAVIMIIAIGSDAGLSKAVSGLIGIAAFIILVFYSLAFEYFMKGQTPGKRMMKVRVARLDGEPVTFGNFLLRWFFRIIDFPLNWPVVGITAIVAIEKNQRVGDLVAGTIIISTRERNKLTDTFYTLTEPGYVPVFPMADQLSARQAEIINYVMRVYASSDKYDLVSLLAERIKDLLQINTTLDDLTFLRTILKDYNRAVSTEVNGTVIEDTMDDQSKWMPKAS